MNQSEQADSEKVFSLPLVIAIQLEKYIKHALELTAALEAYIDIIKTKGAAYPKSLYLTLSAEEMLKSLIIEVEAIMDRAYYGKAINCSIPALKEKLRLDSGEEVFFLDRDNVRKNAVERIEKIVNEYKTYDEKIEILRNKLFAHHDLMTTINEDIISIDVRGFLHEVKHLLISSYCVISDLFSINDNLNYDVLVQDYKESLNEIT